MKHSSILLMFILAISTFKLINTETEDCDANEWVITNTTVQYFNNNKYVVGKLYYNKPSEKPTVYNLRLTFYNCNNGTNCRDDSQTIVDNVECDNTAAVPENYIEACIAGQEASKLEKQKELLTLRYGTLEASELYSLHICIDINDKKTIQN